MILIVKFSSEIIIKSRSVRFLFIKILTKNIKIIFRKLNLNISVKRCWDHLEIKHKNNDYYQISKILTNIPGIHHVVLVQDSIVNSLEDIYHNVILTNCITTLSKKKFCIRVKRLGKHIVSSKDIECYLGNKLRSNIKNISVDLNKPDKTIHLEINNDRLFIVIQRHEGLGGFPIGTQGESISLISGGFDSAVSSYMLIRRGCKIHYCFFNLIDSMQEDIIEVYKMIYYLWNKFSASHSVKLISINFSEIVKEIFLKIKSEFTGIVLKRIMIRTASSIASTWKINTLITGEVLGQVSSQTIDNLAFINKVTSNNNCMILRPLIAYDKELIVSLARHIGTEIFSKKIPEYCGIISTKSNTKSKKKHIELEEKKIDFSILSKLISNAHIMNITDIPKYIEKVKNKQISIIKIQTKLNSTDVILDIRTESEQLHKPLKITQYNNTKIQSIPFYMLIEQFPKLDQNKIYLLYCAHGIMSRLQATLLHKNGFQNVRIYKIPS